MCIKIYIFSSPYLIIMFKLTNGNDNKFCRRLILLSPIINKFKICEYFTCQMLLKYGGRKGENLHILYWVKDHCGQ